MSATAVSDAPPRDGALARNLLRWGLVPHWSQDPTRGARPINARSETVRVKPAFRDAFLQRRCLIPADGFYEWKDKQPYFVQMADERPFVFAGLWEHWDKVSPAIESCTIVTTAPNAVVADIHDRDAMAAEGAAELLRDGGKQKMLPVPFHHD